MLIAGKLMHFQKFGARCYQDEARGVPTQGENGSIATDHPVSPAGFLMPLPLAIPGLTPLGALGSLPCAHQKALLGRGPCTFPLGAVRKVKPPTLTVCAWRPKCFLNPSTFMGILSCPMALPHLGKHWRDGPQNTPTPTSCVLHPRENSHAHSEGL